MAYRPTNNPFYKGNEFLPKAGRQKEFTSEQMDELERCMKDPVHFAEAHFKVVHQDAEDGIIPMKLYHYQREAIEQLVKTRRLLMVTSRQAGKTTIATVIILWAALFNKRKNIALLADKQETATEILERIKVAYEYLPDFLKGGVKKWEAKTVIFENGSKIFASATGSAALRGKSIYMLYIDEAAHVENWESFSASVLPTITAAKTAHVMMTSTPNGMNHYYDYCEAAKKGISEYPLIVVPWWEVPGRDEKWKQQALADVNFNQQKFAQEFECVGGQTLVTIQYNGVIEEITIEELYRRIYTINNT